MSKPLSLALLAASLTLSGIADASASRIRTHVDGDGNVVRTTGYARSAPADFVIEGDNNDTENVAGPCPGGRPSRTIRRGSGQSRLLIAPCIID